MRVARAAGISVTFRSGGTSLSGQALTEGLSVDTRRHFKRLHTDRDGAQLVAEPGVTVRRANAELAPSGRRLGPDPASEIACTIGGIIANNSSGMSCGTHANPYATLASLVAVLPSGTILDTGAPDAAEQLRLSEPDLEVGLIALREELLGRPELVEIVRRRFAMKNTMGYGINALLDHSDPVAILEHLLVGSEGTLGFVAEARFHTVPVLPHIATSLLVFPTLDAATSAIGPLVDTGVAVAELLDAGSLRVAQGLTGCPASITALQVTDQAALLVEYHAASVDDLTTQVARLECLAPELGLAMPYARSTDTAERNSLWTVRKGLYTAVAVARPAGTTALLEDICVPVDQLLATCRGLTGLFEKYAYDGSVIFGHARDGNVHFLINERFGTAAGVERYEAFTADMVDLVLAHDGNLKAEHGTGRVMAPYVQRQYGDDLFAMMHRIKNLFDPDGILNPGVVLPDDRPAALKLPVAVDESVDRCVECGYCEPTCPSKDLTLTPRQRIVVRRDIQTARAAGDEKVASELERDYRYAGVETCAVDGMCALACPVAIDTGDLTRTLRAEAAGAVAQQAWDGAARAWGGVARAGGTALGLARVMPAGFVSGITDVARWVLGTDRMPRYGAGLPAGGTARRSGLVGRGEVVGVYLPACIQTMFGPEPGGTGVTRAFGVLCERAGVGLVVPDHAGSLCCGTPWKSKGMWAGYDTMADRVLPALWEASRHGELPIVCDAASCTEGFGIMAGRREPYRALDVVDATQFVATRLLGRLTVTKRIESVAVHPTCSTTHLGVTRHLLALCESMSDDVVVPRDWGCCAFAGDRGLLHPELTASATAPEAREVTQRDFEAYASANRTCEIAMTRATGHSYRHVLELFADATS